MLKNNHSPAHKYAAKQLKHGSFANSWTYLYSLAVSSLKIEFETFDFVLYF